MYEASFSEVMEIILIILLVYFGFKILFRLFGPLILKYILKKVGQKFESKFHGTNPSNQNKKEGEVSIEKKPKNRKRKSGNDVGEYVDYEEID